MPKVVLVSIFLFFLPLVALAQPISKVLDPQVELSNDNDTATFRVKNGGNKVLRIEKSTLECGIKLSNALPLEIQPGATESLQVKVDIDKMSAGKALRKLRLYTNDPEKSTELLTLSLDIKNDLTISPSPVDFGPISETKGSNSKIISISTGEIVEIGDFGLKTFEVVKGTDSRHLSVKIKEDQPPGKYFEVLNIKIKTASGTETRNVVLIAEIFNGLTTLPKVLRLKKGESKIVKIFKSDPDFVITALEVNNPNISADYNATRGELEIKSNLENLEAIVELKARKKDSEELLVTKIPIFPG